MALDSAQMKLAKRLANELEAAWGDNLVCVAVFGSTARGDQTPTSDIDLLVVAETLPATVTERHGLFYQVESRLDPDFESLRRIGIYTEFSPLLKSRAEASRNARLYLDMTLDCVILHDKNGFFESVLDRLRARLKELNAKRIHLGKKWYWDLKPDYKPGEVFEL